MVMDLESELVERKESAIRAVRNEVKKAICAFANDLHEYRRAGVVFLGVRDDGSVRGVSVTDEVLRNFTAIRNEGTILPIPTISVRRWVQGS
ncbi:MAG: ATP-binding protein [Planctomycetota bacterium]